MTSDVPGGTASEKLHRLDITNRDAVFDAIRSVQPTHIVHLAGVAAPAMAAARPDQAWRVHVDGSLNIAHAILAHAPDAWLVHASSGLIYGSSVSIGHPATESTVPAPIGSYALTKAAGDAAIGALCGVGLRCIRMRPFNHIGPGQSSRFVVPSLATQLAKIEAGQVPPVMHVGNLDVVRDFLDVRDVAKAYVSAIQQTDTLVSGMVLNLASGVGYSVQDLLDELLALSGQKVEIVRDPNRVRDHDLPWLVGDPTLAKSILSWSGEYALKNSLRDVLQFCRESLN
jgi:GDP-4-dehydro-6-deoxy-D-mannose reductase